MSDVARPSVPPPEPPAGWTRLERAAAEAAEALGRWRARAAGAEAEVARLRGALEELGGSSESALELAEQVRRLREENAALRARAAQAYRRINTLLSLLGALEGRR